MLGEKEWLFAGVDQIGDPTPKLDWLTTQKWFIQSWILRSKVARFERQRLGDIAVFSPYWLFRRLTKKIKSVKVENCPSYASAQWDFYVWSAFPPTLPAVTVMGRKRCVGADCSKMAAGCCGVKKQKLSGSPGSGGPGGVGAGSGVAGTGHCGSELGIGSSATVAAATNVSRANGLGGPGGNVSGTSSNSVGGSSGTNALSPVPAGYTSSGLAPNLSPGPGSGSGNRKMVVSAEMCCFCFDVLYCHLYGYQPPRTPRFTNDP